MMMTIVRNALAFTALLALAGCGNDQPESSATEQPATPAVIAPLVTEIEPGLTMRMLERGSGETAEAGQTAVVHYTGWLFDPNATEKRGKKFDSSVDRNQYFRFLLGAGHVIPGWDRGVVGMQVGELRELTIAPDLAYGERGAGDVIPPGSMLVFEVRLAALEGNPDAAQQAE